MAANTLTVPATRGRMGSTTYYTANFPMGMVVKLFTYDPEYMAALPIEYRHQRLLKKNRVPEIAEYILANPDYIFSSITVSVDQNNLKFDSSEHDENVGVLQLPMEAEWLVNDGQHRVAGIAEAIRRDPTVRHDRLSVIILPKLDIDRSQQVFSDLNRTVQKTSKSLDILFDHRLPINLVTNACVDRVRLFKGRTDKENVSLALRSADFVTLSSIQAGNKALLPELDALGSANFAPEDLQKVKDLVVDFWEYVTNLVAPWAEIADGSLKPAAARVDYLSSYALAVAAIGSVGATVRNKYPEDWKEHLQPLKAVDWRKTNTEWQGICMSGGEVITRAPTRKATADQLRFKLGLGPKPKQVLDEPDKA